MIKERTQHGEHESPEKSRQGIFINILCFQDFSTVRMYYSCTSLKRDMPI